MNALVLQGFGLHCYNESFEAVKKAHSKTYLYDLRFPNEDLLEDTKFIIIPGGFSFGDELSAGFMLANYLKMVHPKLYSKIIADNVVTLGICNGFQVLSHTDVFPEVRLEDNIQKHFTYKWTSLKIRQDSFWFEGIKEFEVCVRHGEGRLFSERPIALEYTETINGNPGAGVLSFNHFKLGMMPHPEITYHKKNTLIENGVNYAKSLS